MEEKILKSFIKYMGKEVEGLDLIVSIDPESWEEEHNCVVMEKQDNGKVWDVSCTRNGNVKDAYQVG